MGSAPMCPVNEHPILTNYHVLFNNYNTLFIHPSLAHRGGPRPLRRRPSPHSTPPTSPEIPHPGPSTSGDHGDGREARRNSVPCSPALSSCIVTPDDTVRPRATASPRLTSSGLILPASHSSRRTSLRPPGGRTPMPASSTLPDRGHPQAGSGTTMTSQNVARTFRSSRAPRTAGLMLAGAVTFGCASDESDTASAPDPASSAPGGSALSARDMVKKRFDETPPPKASRKR